MYVISWLRYSSLFQCQKFENMMELTEITEDMFDQSNCDDFRAYRENAINFLALSSKHFPT